MEIFGLPFAPHLEGAILPDTSAYIHEFEEWAGGVCGDYNSFSFYSKDGHEWIAQPGDLVCRNRNTGMFFVIPKKLYDAMQ